MSKGKKILFGIFDWGLGHATRSKTVIDALLKKGHSVDIIATGRALNLLNQNFGKDINEYHDVPSIVSPYTKSKHFCISFILKSPAMLNSLRKARKISKKIIKKGDYDIVISDCRYDVYGKKKKSFLINHQLRFAAPPAAEISAEAWLAYRMSRYCKIIVPDYGNEDNLTGKLSHKLNFIKKKKVEYVGQLSHVSKSKKKSGDPIDYFIMLSGPEPQRTILEEMVLCQAKNLSGKIVIAGAVPEGKKIKTPDNIEYHPFMSGREVQKMLNNCSFLVTRSGYTTIMEMAELDLKNALLIPTPGQTEQEYLASYYEEKGFYHSVTQDRLDLKKDIETAQGYKGFSPKWSTDKSVKKILKIIDC